MFLGRTTVGSCHGSISDMFSRGEYVPLGDSGTVLLQVEGRTVLGQDKTK